MHEDRFDDKIRALLNEVHEDYDGASWDQLNERLDQEALDPTIEETDFIPIVKEKLENQRTPVSEEHWEELKTELDEIQVRRERLYVIKALEAIVVLLLFYTYYNYKWHTTQPQLAQDYFAQVEQKAQDPAMINTVANVTLPITQKKSIAPVINERQVLQKARVDVQSIRNTQWAAINTSQYNQQLANSVGVRLENARVSPIQPVAIRSVGKQDIQSLAFANQPRPASPAMDTPYEREKINEAKGWSFTIPFSYDVNFINTDINLDYLSSQIQSGLEGHSVGIGIAYRKKNLQLESGILYSEKNFVPGSLTSYSRSSENSFLESQLEHMKIEQFQIPVKVKWYASPARSSSLYAVTGFAINTITNIDYDIERSLQAKARLANTPIAEVFDLKDLPRGLATGGSVDENFYMTALLGVGIESVIKNGTSWYFQPQYQHSFTKDINNLVTQINSLNIQMGLRFSF